METVLHAVRYRLRWLAKRPGFASIVLLTLAIGLGPNLTILSVGYRRLLRPLPYPDSLRIVQSAQFSEGNSNEKGCDVLRIPVVVGAQLCFWFVCRLDTSRVPSGCSTISRGWECTPGFGALFPCIESSTCSFPSLADRDWWRRYWSSRPRWFLRKPSLRSETRGSTRIGGDVCVVFDRGVALLRDTRPASNVSRSMEALSYD